MGLFGLFEEIVKAPLKIAEDVLTGNLNEIPDDVLESGEDIVDEFLDIFDL